MLSHLQLCIFGASEQAEATVISQQGFSLLQYLSHMKPPGFNRHTCPSKPNLNDRLV